MQLTKWEGTEQPSRNRLHENARARPTGQELEWRTRISRSSNANEKSNASDSVQ